MNKGINRKKLNLTLSDETRESLIRISKASRLPISRVVDTMAFHWEGIMFKGKKKVDKKPLKSKSRKNKDMGCMAK